MNAYHSFLWWVFEVSGYTLTIVGIAGIIDTLHLAMNADALEHRAKWWRERKRLKEQRAYIKAWCRERYGR